jgi:predicted HAD superfamily Cof-like phosphohydrolase
MQQLDPTEAFYAHLSSPQGEVLDLPQQAVLKFHLAFGHPVNDRSWSQKNLQLRQKLIAEEAQEVSEAIDEFTGDAASKEHIIKELADLLYVIYGTAVVLGVDLQEAFDRVHASNMSKLGPNGKPLYRADGKVLKGPNYLPPNLKDLV